MPQDPMVTWSLPLSQCNFVIARIGKLPIEDAIELYVDLRNQTQQQLQQLQQQMMPQAANGEVIPPPRSQKGNSKLEDRV